MKGGDNLVCIHGARSCCVPGTFGLEPRAMGAQAMH